MNKNSSFPIADLLARTGIDTLNEMQQAYLQSSAAHESVLLQAPTGTGKTLAFLLGMLQHWNSGKTRECQGLIICPSRELVLQTEQVFRSLQTGIKITACYGGHKREIEENSLLETPGLIIGTPGRLCDHIRRANIKPETVQQVILDEFDKCLELGFLEEMNFIRESLTGLQYRTLVSATSLELLPEGWQFGAIETVDFRDFKITKQEADALVEYVLSSSEKDKLPILFQLICHLNNKPAIVFLNHRDAVERVFNYLKDQGLYPVFYHGGMEQRDREVAMTKFRNGTSCVLITTDLAARGLDVSGLRYIIHYHLPDTAETLLHRNGRTARMFEGGKAIYILGAGEKLPEFINTVITDYALPEELSLPEKPRWTTLFIDAGKKDKISKADIAGFLYQKAMLKKEDVGMIDVKDFFSFVAVRKLQANLVVERIKLEKLKGRKIKIAIAK